MFSVLIVLGAAQGTPSSDWQISQPMDMAMSPLELTERQGVAIYLQRLIEMGDE